MEANTQNRRVHLTPDYSISRIIVGGWQLSKGHGGGFRSYDASASGPSIVVTPASGNPRTFLSDLVDRGFTTFDCADIYTGVEEILGDFLGHHRRARPEVPIQIHTKFVPDLDVLPSIDRRYVERIIHRSLRRLGVDALDLVQFHWWDFAIPRYVEVMSWLGALKEEGKIRHLGVTNFDEAHLAELVDSGAEVLSNQVQYSVLDRRPEKALADYCLRNGIALLCYGALAGGFLSEGYRRMTEPPQDLENRSLVKYRLIIEEIGGWSQYQSVLEALDDAAIRAGVPIAAAALRYVLDRPGVAATITGVDSVRQADELLSALTVSFPRGEEEALDRLLSDIQPPPGPVYGLERNVEGPHGAIMRYDLNRN